MQRTGLAPTRAAAAGMRAVLACLWLCAGCTRGSASPADPGRWSEALQAAPVFAPRLSITSRFRPCPEVKEPGALIARTHCPPSRPSGSVRLERLVPRSAADAAEPEALHTLALASLLFGDQRGKALERSILSLRRAALLTDHPAPVLADLAAALIVRAEHTQAPRDLLEAYEAAEEALRRDPRNLAALYNRALALDRVGLVDETAAAWQAYMTVDSASGWGREAASRLRRLRERSIPTPPPPPAGAPDTAHVRFATAAPQEARDLGMGEVLGAWGAAVLAGDEPTAARLLERARVLGAALERAGGDASLADAVRSAAAARSAAARAALARAHRDYAAGQSYVQQGDYPAAEPRFSAAVDGSGGSPVLRQWARLFLGTVRVLNGGTDEGSRLLRAAAADADSARHPALAARARWSLGNTLARQDGWEAGLDEVRRSARLFSSARERENEGAVLAIAADALLMLGEADSSYAAMHRALDRLRPYRASLRLHNLLTAQSTAIAEDGLLRSALVLQNESVAVAERNGNPRYVVEARLARARLLHAAGNAGRVRTDLEVARSLLPRLPDTLARGWFTADLRETQGMLWLGEAPAAAAAALDSAAAYYRPIAVRAFAALVGAAQARLASNDAEGALVRLDSAIRILDERRGKIRMETRRAAIFDAARGVVDRAVSLQLAAGDPARALALMDRARASLAAVGAPGGGHGVRMPEGTAAVEYALVADTLLAWTVRGADVRVYRTVLDTVRLVRTVEGLESMLQAGAGEAQVRPALALLYDWLVRPVAGNLGGAGTALVVVADGALASIPFAALFDARTGRYLAEDHVLRFSVSLASAVRQPPSAGPGGVLLVSDPAFDPRAHPLLERLPSSAAEVVRVSHAFPGATRLHGAAATPRAFTGALLRAEVVHFAGHAVFDDERPERSYLVLASDAGAAGTVTAGELAALDLRHVRLVVLAACRTVRSGPSRAAGFEGLSGALLAAGARGAVGSTWQVDDALTSELMSAFYAAYRSTRDAPAALRQAQLALLRSRDAALRSPAAWAGFRYTGH